MKGKMRFLVPGACVAVGVFTAVYCLLHYELFIPSQGPGAGLLPFALSILLALTGLIGLFKYKNEEEPVMKADNWSIVLAVLLVIIGSYIIGMVPSVLIFAFVWLFFIEKCGWKVTLITMAVIIALVVGVFVLWMDIPFPTGILYETFVG